MKYFDIRPGEAWSAFSRNTDLADRIYEFGMDRVNLGDWAYVNPATGFGIFEDAEGNFLFLELVDQGAENRITDMHCGLRGSGPSEIADFVDTIVHEFGLVTSPMADA